MRRLVSMLLLALLIVGCAKQTTLPNEWTEYDYSDPVQRFRAEQAIQIDADGRFQGYFECKVWCRKHNTLSTLYYYEGYIARPDNLVNKYLFLYDLRGPYLTGDYSECKYLDFNDELLEPKGYWPIYQGHYYIDKLIIKR